jgi:hypothetical protein
MNINSILLAAVLTPCLVCVSMADDRRGGLTEKSAEAYDLAVRPSAKANGNATDTSAISEVFENVVIAAGKTVSLSSALDYSPASTVAVTVLCIICSSAATSLGNSGLVLQARWTVPDAQSFVTAESKAATAFTYSDSGGAVFNVYGPQFRLALQNKGTQTIALQQVTIFRRSQ